MNKKLFISLCFAFISFVLMAHDKPFKLILAKDTLTLNKLDTVFSYSTKYVDYYYDKGIIKTEIHEPGLIIHFKLKVNPPIEQDNNQYNIVTTTSFGWLTTTDVEGNVLINGMLHNGNPVGIWHNMTEDYASYKAYDSLGFVIPFSKIEFDSIQQQVRDWALDTTTFTYTLMQKVNVVISPEYFLSIPFKDYNLIEYDQYLSLNTSMDSLGFKSSKLFDNNFVRFILMRNQHPIYLNIMQENATTAYQLTVSNAENINEQGKAIQSITQNELNYNNIEKLKNELDKLDFWQQKSTNQYNYNYIIIEARINNKYNVKRINEDEYKKSEYKDILKLLKQITLQLGLDKKYALPY